jgi:hypothetical protein
MGIRTALVSLITRARRTGRGSAETKVILPNCVNIKSKASVSPGCATGKRSTCGGLSFRQQGVRLEAAAPAIRREHAQLEGLPLQRPTLYTSEEAAKLEMAALGALRFPSRGRPTRLSLAAAVW